MLNKVDYILLNNSCDKKKKDFIQEEVNKQKENLKVFSSTIMSYFTATKACNITSYF